MSADTLILVNAAHPVCREPARDSLVYVGPKSDGVLMERRAAALLEQLMKSIGGWGKIAAVSGWRSLAEQQEIWNDTLRESGEDFTRKYVAVPGCSEHQTGLAIDLGLREGEIDFIRPRFTYDGVCRAFRERAARYGFIERYPAGRESVTGIAHEAWHFRYVGVPHAEIMQKLGLTLEEYVVFLRDYPADGESFKFASGEFEFSVSYLPDGKFASAQPSGGLTSSDNDGGYIMTTWKSREN